MFVRIYIGKVVRTQAAQKQQQTKNENAQKEVNIIKTEQKNSE